MGRVSLRSAVASFAMVGTFAAAALLIPTIQVEPAVRVVAAASAVPILIPAAQPALPLPVTAAAPLPEIVTSQAGVLVDVDTGRILWRLNDRQQRPIASLTKIFTAMQAASLVSNLDRPITVPASITQIPWDSTVMGLTIGETVTVRDLLYGMFLPSGNDAAVALSAAVEPQSTFIAGMNQLAVQIGLHDTHFTNPWGADDPAHYASALDLATAAAYLDAHYPGLAAIAATPTLDIPASATHKAFHLHTLDKLLDSYPGLTGLKTGWTGQAGGCLISTAARDGHHLVGVLLGSSNTFAEMRALLDYGFAVEEPTSRD